MTVTTDLSGRRVLVVGGSAGIGRGTALAAAAFGAAITVVGRSEERLAEVLSRAGRGTAIAADVKDEASCVELVEASVDAMGGLDVVVYSAGVSPLTPLDEVDGQTWRDVLATNTIAPALVAQAALGHLSSDGVIAFLSSTAVGGGHHGLAPYGASKAALNRTVGAWRTERPDRRFVCMAIGDTHGTEFARDFDVERAAALFPKWLAAGVVFQNHMDADDLGRAIVEFIAMLLAHPGLTIPELTVVPTGPMMTGDAEPLLETLASAVAHVPGSDD